MINFDQLKQYMNRQNELDKEVKSVETRGDSLEEALSAAAVELGIKVDKLEYEVIERGNKGVLGVGKKEWIISAYEATKKVNIIAEIAPELAHTLPDVIQVRDLPGEAIVKCNHDGVFLKVTKPIGKAAKATDKMAIERLIKRGVMEYDQSIISKVVNLAQGEYIKISEYDYNPINDAIMTVDIVDMEMKAYMSVRPPGRGGADLSLENMVGIIQNNGIQFGILEDVLARFEDYPEYNSSILVAEGKRPVNGKNAQITYHFNTDRSRMELKEEGGRVDFKELNLVENVVAGQVLAKKIPPEKGEDGRTVTGKILPSKSGKNESIYIGKNVKLSEDGNTAISEINGQALLLNGKINVEPVYTIAGDVNLQTGNILFLGTVIIKGSVLDGFSVKAAGNVEVKGNVGKCIIDAEGDVIVHQGILGKNGGKVKSGKNIFSKFIENAHIEAAENVVVNEGILHSQVDSKQKIICHGRRASIVGGRLRASEEINAKNFGSIAGAETILEVGYDPESKGKLQELDKKYSSLEKEMDDLELNIRTLMNMKKVQKKLSDEKENNLMELNKKKEVLLNELEDLNSEMEAIKDHLNTLKEEGRVSASEKVFPGVKIFIKDAYLEVKNEFKFVTFILENGNVRVTKYEGIDDSFKRRIV